jgi:hypothetical protein
MNPMGLSNVIYCHSEETKCPKNLNRSDEILRFAQDDNAVNFLWIIYCFSYPVITI